MKFEERLDRAIKIALEQALSFHRRTKMKPANIAVDEDGQSAQGATRGATQGASRGHDKKKKKGSAHKNPVSND